MKKLGIRTAAITAFIALVTGSTFGQDVFNPNLKGRVLCISTNSAEANIVGDTLMSRSLTIRLATELERRLTLSRVAFKKANSCVGEIFVGVTVETTDGPTSRAMSAEVQVADLGSAYPAPVIIWIDSTFGFSRDTGLTLELYLLDAAREKIENLALAWIKANP